MTTRILLGDCLDSLTTLDSESVQCVVTSPPYWGLRDYGHAGQIGLEATPDEYVAKLVAVFREVRRVLRNDGTLWLNLGDSYANDTKWGGQTTGKHAASLHGKTPLVRAQRTSGLKAKDLVGIPWMVAFALRADGWYLRSDIIWHKPNPMPESVTDRPTKSHEYLFLLAKSERYFYDADAIREECVKGAAGSEFHTGKTGEHQLGRASKKQRKPAGWDTGAGGHGSFHREGRAQEVENTDIARDGRNRRTVWTIPTHAFAQAHFATFPPALVEPCILAGSRIGDTVLDPFGGAGTTALVADRLGRNSVLCELSPEYAEIARLRVHDDAPLFADGAA